VKEVSERALTSEDDYAVSADLYDHVTLYRERADIAFYVEEATRVNGLILELGCGIGWSPSIISQRFPSADVVGVDGSLDRGTQTGSRVESGVLFEGTRGAIELFVAGERRIDAYPLDVSSLSWFSAGFRFVSR